MLLRKIVGLLALWFGLLAGFSTTAQTIDALAKTVLAPAGYLRVGVYPGSPTSMVRDPKTGDSIGIALNLGQELGRQLGVPVQVVEFGRLALVLEALKAGAVDFTFTNATEIRSRDMDFTDPLVQLELGILVPPVTLLNQVADVDRAGVRLGVAQSSSSLGTLALLFKNATLVPAASLEQARQMLLKGELDAFATNKGILFEMSENLPGFHVLDGRWGIEKMAIAIPKGRDAARPYLRQFAQDVQSNGLLQSIVLKLGLRGTLQTN